MTAQEDSMPAFNSPPIRVLIWNMPENGRQAVWIWQRVPRMIWFLFNSLVGQMYSQLMRSTQILGSILTLKPDSFHAWIDAEWSSEVAIINSTKGLSKGCAVKSNMNASRTTQGNSQITGRVLADSSALKTFSFSSDLNGIITLMMTTINYMRTEPLVSSSGGSRRNMCKSETPVTSVYEMIKTFSFSDPKSQSVQRLNSVLSSFCSDSMKNNPIQQRGNSPNGRVGSS